MTIYVDSKQHKDERWTTPIKFTDAEAKRLRDARAKVLRKEGWTVKVGKMSFSGLGYGNSFWLEASR